MSKRRSFSGRLPARCYQPSSPRRSISPGYFVTDLNRAHLESEHGEALQKRIAMRRFGQFPDLDGALLLLASPASGFMTGSDVVVDGGHLLTPL